MPRGGLGATPYLEEALRWLSNSPDHDFHVATAGLIPEYQDGPIRHVQEDKTPVRILLADDNADMRHYLQRLLSSRYEVTAGGIACSLMISSGLAGGQRPL